MKIGKFGGWIVAAALFSGGCADGGTSAPYVRNVYSVRPVAAGHETVKSYSGVVKAAHEISLGFKTPGQIERVHVAEGDYVRRGQLLAELDDADYRLAVEALQIQYDQLRDEVERTGQLFRQQSVSANDYEKASAGLRQLGVRLQVNRNKLDYTKLCAPTDGYIRSVNFSAAEMVDAGTAVFSLLDLSGMEVEADIPVGEYRNRERFIRYSCRVPGLDAELPMRLLSLTPAADGNQLYRLRLAFDGVPDRRLTAGMNVGVGVVVADTETPPGVSVPLSAVFHDGAGACVWVIREDSTLVKRPVVVTGADAAGRAVVGSGLTAREQIVRSGTHVLHEGEKVRILSRSGETNVGDLL